eukprot:1926224-Alexandrium_andersonii.AAC.1
MQEIWAQIEEERSQQQHSVELAFAKLEELAAQVQLRSASGPEDPGLCARVGKENEPLDSPQRTEEDNSLEQFLKLVKEGWYTDAGESSVSPRLQAASAEAPRSDPRT